MRTFSIISLLTILLAACGVNAPQQAVAPQVVDMYPAHASEDVAVATSIWAVFDADVDPTWLTESFALTDAFGATITVTLAYDAATWTVTAVPSSALAYDTAYEAAFVGGGVSTSSAGVLSQSVSWTFSTEAAPADDGDGDGSDGDGDGNGDGNDGDGDGNGDGSDGDGSDGDGNDGDGNDGDGNDGDGNDGDGDGGDGGDADATCLEADDCYSYSDTTLDSISIPAGATLNLTNVTVTSNVAIGAGATLNATNVTVEGNFSATGATAINLTDSHVWGNLTIHEGGSASIQGTTLGFNVELTQNAGSLVLDDNQVTGNIRIELNTGGVVVTNNASATGSLDCSANDPDPTGSGNTLGGGMTGQCTGF